MSVITALSALKTAFLAISGPASIDSRVWAWPADRASITYETFPFILCSQLLSEAGVWRPSSQGVAFHDWPAEVLICLNHETQREDVSAADEAAAQAWLYAAADVLFANRGLGGTTFDIGTPDSLLTTQIGNMGWLGPKTVFWGVYVRTVVRQLESLPSV